MDTILLYLRWTFRIIFVILVLSLIIYLALPSPEFPPPPPNSYQSMEPGDIADTDTLRAYYTDSLRAEVIGHYRTEFQHPGIFAFIPSYQLNYPPEESAWYVKDLIKSNYLEETVYPLRESIYINGYEPKDGDDIIAYEGQQVASKVTIRYYQSPLWVRLLVVSLGIIVLLLLGRNWWRELKRLFNK